jgi:hypothetical protein
MNAEWIRRRWWEFRFGHSTYLSFFVSFSQFIILAYTLYLPRVSWVFDIFPNISVFALVFVSTYIPLAVLIGHYIHRKRQMQTELVLSSLQNPLGVGPAYLRFTKFQRVEAKLDCLAKRLAIPDAEWVRDDPVFDAEFEAYRCFMKRESDRLGWKP